MNARCGRCGTIGVFPDRADVEENDDTSDDSSLEVDATAKRSGRLRAALTLQGQDEGTFVRVQGTVENRPVAFDLSEVRALTVRERLATR